jgi:arylsulfatase A-like enzyme
MKKELLSAIQAGFTAGLGTGVLLGIFLTLVYPPHFENLSLLNLVPYLAGKLGIFSLAAAGAAFLFFTFTSKIIRRPLFHNKGIGFYTAGLLSLYLTLGIGLFVNFNVLRYSRDIKSYAVNFFLLCCGIIVFFLLNKFISRPMKQKPDGFNTAFIITGLIILIFFSFWQNPFAYKFSSDWLPVPKQRNYEASGRYLYDSLPADFTKLNIILFSIDTLREDGLSCYGNPRLTSPQIDSLINDSLVFSQVYSQSSWTLPSHMTMISALYPSTHGCTTSPIWTKDFERLDDYWVTLAEVLKNWGYQTAAFTDGALLGPKFNFSQGFDVCDDSGGGIQNIAQKAMAWMENRRQDSPFFLFLHCYDVHNYMPPEDLKKKFTAGYKGQLLKYHHDGNALPHRITANAFSQLSKEDIAFLRGLYDAEIYHTDREFGKILRFLKSRNLYHDAVIIVTSDHGEEFWEHGGTGHGWSLHQHQLKVPLIWKSPAFTQKGRKIDHPAGLIDIYPTLLDSLGMPVPHELQGMSLVPMLQGGQYPARSFIAEASHLKNQKCIIKDGYAYLYNKYPPLGENLFDLNRFLYTWRSIFQSRPDALYDLENDPDEQNNLAGRYLQKTEPLKNELFKKLSAFSARRLLLDSNRAQMDKKTLQELRSLGYIK